MIASRTSDDPKKPNLLSSWKEISTYLDCDIRTCMRWEKEHNLPVYRMGQSSRSRVFSYREELDLWLKKSLDKKMHLGRDLRNEQLRQNRKFPWKWMISGACLLLLFLLRFFIFFPRTPIDFRIEGSELVILNKNGHKIWRYDTGADNMFSSEKYKLHSQHKSLYNAEISTSLLPYIIIRDIDGDGRTEVLFSCQLQDEMGEKTLLCLDDRGKEKWRFEGGRNPLVYGEVRMSNSFRVSGFNCHDFDRDGRLEILILVKHTSRFPFQIVLLDDLGKKTGEYWNTGYLSDYGFADLNGDGRDELLLAGCNNEYKKGVMLVFDPFELKGCSPQFKADSRQPTHVPGSEKFYVVFPLAEVNRFEAQEGINLLSIQDPERIQLTALTSQLIFNLNFRLEMDHVVRSHYYQRAHDKMKADGYTTIDWRDPDYEKRLEEGLLYFNGREFTSVPSMSNPWN